MPQHVNVASYPPISKFFHWVMAALILGMLILGWYMDDIATGMQKFTLIQTHKSIGITILLLAAFRLLFKFTNPGLMLPAQMPLWQKAAAHITHTSLYILMFAMPLSGYLMSDAAGYHPTWFGLPVPILMQPNPILAGQLAAFHTYAAYAIWTLLAAHVTGALYHHLIVRDDTLRRMAPSILLKR